MATTPLTTDYLQENIVEVIPTVYEQRSALTAAGATSVGYETTELKQNSVGGANIVGEGEVKPLTDHNTVRKDAKEVTLTHVFVATNQFLDTNEGRADAAAFITGAAESLIQSADIAVLHGTNPASGVVIADLQEASIVPAAGHTVVQDAEEAIDEAIYRGLVEGTADDFILLSNAGLRGIQYAQLNGVAKFVQANRNASFPFWASEAQAFEAAGIDGFTATEKITNDVLAVNGNFSGIRRAFGTVKVDFFDQAVFGGVSLAETNQVAYRVEQTVRFFNTNPEDFTVVQSA